MAARAQEGLEELSHVEGQEGSGEEIPLVQGKEQWLCFAGAAMKRYPMPKVRETQVQPTPVFLPGESQGWGSLATMTHPSWVAPQGMA